ncbi:MAG TPA: putative lipid II flippase FtsW [Firmicutes bacterium]|nr:putative lipid II flippase FtsW [Bacillota bacterium]
MGGPGRKRKKEAQQVRSVSQRQQRAAPRRAASGALAPEVGKVKRRVRKKFKLFSARGGVDRPLFYLILVLLVIGLIMLFSASYAYSYYYFDNSYHFITPQALFAVFGLVLMGLISLFDYHHLHKFAFPLFFITLGLLVAVKVLAGTSIAPILNGANRWLYIGPVNFQPSEVAKFALVLIFAHLISINYHKMGTFRYGVLPYLIILLMIAGLILVENHVSATLIILAIAAVMLFIGGVKLRWFGVAGGLAGVGILYLVLYSDKFSYALDRIKGWWYPFNPPEGVDTWQTQQSLMAIGSGQALGLGLGQSRQKYLYLPEPQNDFIFAIVCEELGFVGALVIILLFALLIWRGIVVSLNANDKFGTMLGIGITAQVGIQVILNIMVVTNSIPNTGISLPFFSYGGTSLVILLCEMGVLLSISRSSSLDKT